MTRTFLCLGLAVSLASATPILRCDRERYYEGETIFCPVPQDSGTGRPAEGVTLILSMSGKEISRLHSALPFAIKTLPGLVAQLPSGLKTVTPLRLEAIFTKKNGSSLVSKSNAEFQIFPRATSYWIRPHEFEGKRLAVFDPQNAVIPEIRALGIPFQLLENLPGLDSRLYDLLIVAPVRVKDAASAMAFGFLPRLVSKGWKILFLEQESFDVEPSTFSTDPFGFVRVSPIANRLTWTAACLKEDLLPGVHTPSRWGRDEALGYRIVEVDGAERPRTLWGYGGCSEQSLPTRGLALEVKEGKGRYIFNEVNILEHLGDEPLARWWLLHMIRRAVR